MNAKTNPDSAPTSGATNELSASQPCTARAGCETLSDHLKTGMRMLRSRTAHLTDDVTRTTRSVEERAGAVLRTHPYQTVGAVAGIAFLLGYLASRR